MNAFLMDLARIGAKQRVEELAKETADLRRTFPDIFAETSQRPRMAKARLRRHRMSKAQRMAVSRRMKAYWAKRRRVA